MERLKELLHRHGHSLALCRACGVVTAYNGRGVSDLLCLLTEYPELLRGSLVADKVVGKGAAALMAAGGVREVYADLMSQPALELLHTYNITATYGTLAPHILNRAKSGLCPVETLCAPCQTAEECVPLIRQFIESKR